MYCKNKRNVLASHVSVLHPIHFTCTHPDVTLGNDRGCPLVVHFWAVLQSVHGLRRYGNICTKCELLASAIALAVRLVPQVNEAEANTGTCLGSLALYYHGNNLLLEMRI